jgi:hypothetical protein
MPDRIGLRREPRSALDNCSKGLFGVRMISMEVPSEVGRRDE